MKKSTPSQPPPSEGPVPTEAAESSEEREDWTGPIWAEMNRRAERAGLRERRAQRQKLVADLIAKHRGIRSQGQLQELLQQRGVLATQSSISRDLRDLGVRRVKGIYVIKPSRSGGWSFDDVTELIEMVARSGPYTTVIQTIPDAARLVARTLEEAGWEEVVGTVAGDDTIFVATRSEEDQDQLFERFKKYLSV